MTIKVGADMSGFNQAMEKARSSAQRLAEVFTQPLPEAAIYAAVLADIPLGDSIDVSWGHTLEQATAQ